MSVSQALENSAIAFNRKYACHFDFTAFESRVEEFTFLRPNSGWVDVYKMTFDHVYKRSMEAAALRAVVDLNAEAMLDDYEYTLIRPYVNESDRQIRHKPYTGMDRMTRLEYLDRLMGQVPKNAVELYAEKYRNGELSLKQMRASGGGADADRAQDVAMVSYVRALETVSSGRTAMWRALHPFKSNAEKRDAAQMKKTVMEAARGGEDAYRELVRAAYEPFDGHRRATENLMASMVRAKEEMTIHQKMNEVRRESIRVDLHDQEPSDLRSPPVDPHTVPMREKQI